MDRNDRLWWEEAELRMQYELLEAQASVLATQLLDVYKQLEEQGKPPPLSVNFRSNALAWRFANTEGVEAAIRDEVSATFELNAHLQALREANAAEEKKKHKDTKPPTGARRRWWFLLR